ncbi:alpha/beta hydrolase [Muricauda sp. 334s03]|uniref:Alpha/beta hydrolase n=1 Tax=Flagellimonas yonaguniensis TaxID=3031325 RepID=A0ABT5XZ01_9FLAO|nr:alpha/beta hydrolase [[Muricauda] yonaguniensis]MDF0716416.1 alpha/beta hydrolase [[Muricauda] yonaguniensis]
MKHLFITIFIVLSHGLFGQESMVGSNNIDTTQFVRIGGIEQFISIKGNKGNPLMLYLHGGPGAATSSHRQQITNILEEHFIVVHWDQRGAGKSLNANLKPPTLSVMKQDAEELLLFLLKEFNKDRIVLVANSWGTVLGFHLALKYPNNMESLVAISPLINNQKSQNLTNKKLINHYNEDNKIEAVKQLKSIHIPYEKVEDMAIQFRWISDFKGVHIPDTEFNQYMKFFKEWEQQWMPLYKELYSINFLKHKSVFKIPTYILIGEQDLTTSFELTEKFFKRLEAPKKQLFWLKDVGHQIPMYKSEEMQNLICNILLNDNE